MRYSMLVYLVKMSKTLLEAAQYLRAAPADDPLRDELLENGRQMIGQIQEELRRHQADLRSGLPQKYMETAKELWDTGGADLEAALQVFAECFPREVHYQVRAVFFAELGEKWDAMESVYEYMRDDPQFDPVVVRTPVGRVVMRDGKREQEIIYRDFLTPMGIPSLGYDQYDIKEDCPDLAFISQPYESCTPKEFWPEYIAKYTRLVYLPYYLPDMASEASVNSLAQLPVYRFAWKAVCATEKQYKFYCRHAVNQGANALVTGIPKTDPLVRLAREPVRRPEEWKALDGRTVFLWNSWYDFHNSSLRYADALLDWFHSRRDCALLWRPHPMTDTVAKLYAPDCYPAYQEMLKRVREAENMVLDTEVSCMAAFSVSDAMISDYSSLLPQYLFLDKPALWMKTAAFRFTGENFIESSWMEQAGSTDDVFAFLERILRDEDRNAALRRAIRQRDLPLADGRCGERVCETLWREMFREDFPDMTSIQKKEG